ncbi:hypothetical protein V6N11_002103 [Hibiscus sabdariffa]|uniref:Uncharacterized protein n=1 Tax=Hibiscus sabdariffa TaxID=183260 RepID=A0ABR2QUG0_9ROSI
MAEKQSPSSTTSDARTSASKFQSPPLTVPVGCSRNNVQTELCQPRSHASIARESTTADVVTGDIFHSLDDATVVIPGHGSSSEADANSVDNVAGVSEPVHLAADESHSFGEPSQDLVGGETECFMGAGSSDGSAQASGTLNVHPMLTRKKHLQMGRSGKNVVQH